jgi:hypothetical protein
MRWLLLVCAVGVGACDKADSASRTAKSGTEPGGVTLAGIWPKEWTCDRIGTESDIGQLLGGTAKQYEGPVQPPDGVPMPCNYLLPVVNGEESWTFDIDCRDSYKRTADALFVEWGQRSTDNVARYNIEADAAPVDIPKPTPTAETPDARPPGKAPEGAHDVAVGRRGLDALGQGLIFIDDDAPCYVRVVGPDAAKRLALAQHVATRLTVANAPMTPRAAE